MSLHFACDMCLLNDNNNKNSRRDTFRLCDMFQFVFNVPQRFFFTDGGFVIANLEIEGQRPSLKARIGYRAHFLYGYHCSQLPSHYLYRDT